MPALRFDWRWIALLIIIVVLANTRSLPWPLTALALAIPAGWLLYQAAQTLGIDLPGTRPSTRVTYWRGRRIETSGPSRRQVVNRANLAPDCCTVSSGWLLHWRPWQSWPAISVFKVSTS